MEAQPTPGPRTRQPAAGANRIVAFLRRPTPRFVSELLGMCAVMCIGGNILSILFFDVLGNSNLVHQAPALSVLVIVFNLALPMTAYMALRGHGLRHNLAMTSSTAAVGLLVIAALWFGAVSQSSILDWSALFGLVCGPACMVMGVQMVRSFDMYSGRAGHRAQPA